MGNNKYHCCLCGKENCGYGNNPQPIENDGRCCDECNAKYVIPTRFMLATSGASPIRKVRPEAKRFYHYLKNKNESTLFGNDESNT